MTLVGLALGPAAWTLLIFRVWEVTSEQRRPAQFLPLLIGLLAGIAIIVAVLMTAASFDVVGAAQYQIMYALLGMAWLRCACELFPFAGVSFRDDVIERSNEAAAAAWTGALIGVACCYAGANIGDGPGWYVVVFCALLSTGTLITAWIALTRFSPVADSVTIDRDGAAGLRLGAFLISCGVILGRATAGDWVSAESALADFLRFLPAVIALIALATLFEQAARPTAQRPRPSLLLWGVLPSIMYLAIPVGELIAVGLPL